MEPPATSETSWLYPGWRVAVASAIAVFLTTLIYYLFPVLLGPMTASLGQTRGSLAAMFALVPLSASFMAPVWGRLLDRVAPHRVIVPCILVCGAAIATLAWAPSSARWLPAQFVALGVSISGTTPLAYARLLSSWFDRRRGAALGLLLAGIAVGGIVVPPVAQALVAPFGWRAVCAGAGAAIAGLAVPLVLLFVRQGAAQSPPAARAGSAATRAAFSSRRYWVLLGLVFVGSAANGGVLVHLVPLLGDRGWTPERSAAMVSLLGVATLCGRFGTGWLLDRLPATKLTALLLLSSAAGVLLLAATNSPWAATLCVVLLGFGIGGELDAAPYLLSRYFGLSSLSSLYGFVWTAQGTGTAVGVALLGRAFDATGSYSVALVAIALANLAASALVLALPEPERAGSPS